MPSGGGVPSSGVLERTGPATGAIHNLTHPTRLGLGKRSPPYDTTSTAFELDYPRMNHEFVIVGFLWLFACASPEGILSCAPFDLVACSSADRCERPAGCPPDRRITILHSNGGPW